MTRGQLRLTKWLDEHRGRGTALAGALSVDRAAVTRWRNGERLPLPETRERLCLLTGVPVEDWDEQVTDDGAHYVGAKPAEEE
jgi:transcriptional regulator with XRE-family HTH domain